MKTDTNAMRQMMTLMEAGMQVPGVPGGADPKSPLTGVIDIKGLAKMLPDVTNPAQFVSGMQKVRSGRINALTLQERGQLAMAFVSILRDDRSVTLQVMRRLAMVQARGV